MVVNGGLDISIEPTLNQPGLWNQWFHHPNDVMITPHHSLVAIEISGNKERKVPFDSKS